MKTTKTTKLSPAERRNAEMLAAVQNLLSESVAQNAHNEVRKPQSVRIALPSSWKGWAVIAVIALAIFGAMTPDTSRTQLTSNPAPVVVTQTILATETATVTVRASSAKH